MSRHSNHRAMFLCAVFVTSPAAVLLAGDIAPPAGPVTPTHKTLTEVEPRVAINAENTPGDADSVFRIAQPGSYYLSESITGALSKTTIKIAASDVTLDLCGFTISGAGVGRGIKTFGAVSGITIRNGIIRNTTGGDAVDLDGASGCVLEGLIARSNSFNGFTTGTRCVMRNCLSISNGSIGISAGADSVIENCQALDNTGSHGIVLSSRCRAIGCVARNSGTAVAPDFGGINVNPSALNGLIQNCFVTGNDRGIIISGTGWTVINNVAKANIGPNYSIIPGNHVGAITADPATAGPFANISN